MNLPLDNTEEFLQFAFDSARSAGALSLPYFRPTPAGDNKPPAVDNKAAAGSFDPVTAADRAVEEALRAAISQRFPEHGILGEEFAEKTAKSDYRWIIDPIDGTRSFISGVPAWGVLLGLQYRQQMLFGLMHQPYLDETFLGVTAEAMHEARFLRAEFSSPQSMRVSSCAKLGEAILFCTHPEIFDGLGDAWQRFESVANQVRLLRYGGDCYCYCMLALGQIDLVIEAGLQAYDILPLIPVIEAAGGVVTDWQGQALTAGGDVIAASSAELHAEALAILQQG